MSELDTITDFTGYLQKKEAFLRSGRLATAAGEENLLAYYAIRMNTEGEHDFTAPGAGIWHEGQTVDIGADEYAKLVSDPRYQAKKAADNDSYIWDRLITAFTDRMLDGTSMSLYGFTYELQKSELGVRYMALEPRFRRRAHGRAILDALEKGRQGDRFFRAMLPRPDSAQNETGFFILTFAYKDFMDATGGYDKYREFRVFHASTYATASLMRSPYLKRIVGVAVEPPGKGRGGSEDLIYAEQQNWSAEQRAAAEADCSNLGIMSGALRERHVHESEFPDPKRRTLELPDGSYLVIDPSSETDQGTAPPRFGMNRRQRRAAIAKARSRKHKEV